jgi:hypothetical protein
MKGGEKTTRKTEKAKENLKESSALPGKQPGMGACAWFSADLKYA